MSSKKTFIAVAATIKLRTEFLPKEASTLRGIANDLCAIFAKENPAFDRARFMAACGF